MSGSARKKRTVTRLVHREEEMVALGAQLGRCVRPGDVVALTGGLGAGKTCFVRGMAQGMGLESARVNSPTYVLVNEYDTPATAGASAIPLVHIDAYRLTCDDDADTLGLDYVLTDGFSSASCVVAVEWASCVEDKLPSERFTVAIAHVDVLPSHMGAGADDRGATAGAEEGDSGRRHVHISCPTGRKVEALVESSTRCACTICGAAMETACETFPFCSKRCRLVDLGKWFGGNYRISRGVSERDLDAFD